MSPPDDPEPDELVLDDESDVIIEELESDARVQAVLDSIEIYTATGEDQALVEPAAATQPARPVVDERPPDVRKEHATNVRPAKVHQVELPKQSIVINEPKRRLSEVAQDAGVSLGEFKQLSAGDRRARTMLAAKLVDHMDEKYGQLLRQGAAAHAAAGRRPAEDSGSAPLARGHDGADALAALPSLDADGTVLAPDPLAAPPIAGAATASGDGRLASGIDVLAALPSLDVDGTVLESDPGATASADGAGATPSPVSSSAGQRLAAAEKRRRLWLLAAAAAIVALVTALLCTL